MICNYLKGLEKDFQVWKRNAIKSILKLFDVSNNAADSFLHSCTTNETELEAHSHTEDESDNDDNNNIMDVEDIGLAMKKEPKVNDTNEMVTPQIRQSLTKQGVIR